MKSYNNFRRSLTGCLIQSDVKSQTVCYGHSIVEDVKGHVFVDYKLKSANSLQEAATQIKQQELYQDIHRQIQQDLYEEISLQKVADIIHRHHVDIKITDTLVESYIKIAASKLFTTDPVVAELRQLNTLDRVVEGYVDFIINDGTTIVISESVQQQLNNLFGSHPDVVDYIRENRDNFLNVLNQLED